MKRKVEAPHNREERREERGERIVFPGRESIEAPSGAVWGAVGLVLLVLQVLLIFLSWALSALYPHLQLHSLISGEGLRWAFRNLFASHTMTLLPSLVILTVAIGLLAGSRLLQPTAPRQFIARLLLLLMLSVGICVVALPAMLTPTGRFLPMTLVNGIIPLLSLVVILFSLVGGTIVGNYRSPADIVHVALRSLAKAAPLMLLYMLLAQLWAMLQYVFI